MASFLATTESYRSGARTLGGRYYTSEEILAEENQRVFGRGWICVGREESIAEPGAYELASIAGESIIVLRDRSGTVRAYAPRPYSPRESIPAAWDREYLRVMGEGGAGRANGGTH